MRGPLTFTPLPRLLRLKAMVPALKNGIEVCPADMSWGSWVLPIVLYNEIWCLDIGGYLPRVVFSVKTLPLDQELEPLVPATI